METYLRQVYDGSDREDLLKSSNNELILSEQAIKDFEAFLNNNIPLFDREMYESISFLSADHRKKSQRKCINEYGIPM